ncbi:hypothetical protein D3C85_983450 [compost metagenome]
MESPGQFPFQQVQINPGVCGPDQIAEPVHGGTEITLLVKLVINGRRPEFSRIRCQILTGRLIDGKRLKDGFSRQHSGFHGRVGAFDLGKIQGAGITSNQQAPWEVHLRQRLKPAFRNGSRAVADARATAQILLVKRVMLELLKLIKRRQVRIAIVEIHDLPDHHSTVLQVIHEGAALRATLGQWPSSAMNHKPGNMLLSGDFPDFLDAQPVVLRIGVRIELILADQLFAQVPATAFSEDGLLADQLDTGRKAAFLLPGSADAHVGSQDTPDPALLVVQHVGRRKAWKHIDTESLSLLTQPTTYIAQADDEVAFVVHRARREDSGNPD